MPATEHRTDPVVTREHLRDYMIGEKLPDTGPGTNLMVAEPKNHETGPFMRGLYEVKVFAGPEATPAP